MRKKVERMNGKEELKAILGNILKKTIESKGKLERRRTITEIAKALNNLDLGDIDALLDTGCFLLTVYPEEYEEERQKTFNTIARGIAEIAGIEPPEYTKEKAKHFRDTMTNHLLLALRYTEC